MSVDLILLGGFLGSGKTTLLVDYLSRAEAAGTGVIVNEVGEIGLDGAIIEEDSNGLPTMMLANGCVCCSLRSTLVDTVVALLDGRGGDGVRAPLRRIILETSGVSRPGPIIASLADPALRNRGLRVSTVGTYDCEIGALNVETFEEAAAQLAAAQRIVFTKMDKACADEVRRHRGIAASVNPLAQIVAEPDRNTAVAQAFSPLPAQNLVDQALRALIEHPSRHDRHPRIEVMMGSPARSDLTWPEIAEWLDDVAAFCGERLLRLKALIRIADCPDPILLQSVGTTFSAPRRMRMHADAPSGCVLITRDLDAEALNGMLADPPMHLSATGRGPALMQ